MNINNLKEIRFSNKTYKKIIAVILCVIIVIASYMVIDNAGKAAKDTVDIIRIKPSEGIPAKTSITENDVEKYPLIRKEFEEHGDMITYDKLDQVLGMYTLYYLREKTPVTSDVLSPIRPLKNEWLYSVDPNNEVITIPYNYLSAGGDILTPGDKIRVRITYESTQPDASQSQVPDFSLPSTDNKYKKVQVLFESITVCDLLNSNGHSIYEVYKEVLRLSEQDKHSVMTSDEFLQNIRPRSLLLEATREQANIYAKYGDIAEKSLTITILSRQNNENIIDQLPIIEKEIELWGSKKKN